MRLFDGMANGQVGIDLVAVTATDPSPLHVTRANDIGNDRLSGSLGHANPGGNVSTANGGVLGEAHQHQDS